MRFLILAVLLVPAFTAMAAPTAADERVPTVSEIVDQQVQIRADVKAGKGRYKNMSPTKRDDLLAKQADLLEMVSGKTSLDELSENQRTKAFKTLDWIQTAVNNNESEKLICHREKTIGSNRVTRVCRTEAEVLRARQNARDQLRSSDGVAR